MDIYVDWGSTNFRAFLMDGAQIVDKTNAPGHGILQSFLKVPVSERDDRFSQFLCGQLGSWLTAYPEAEIFMCGAIGSREGWLDTGYVNAPANLDKLAKSFRKLNAEENIYLPARSIFILPGLAIEHANARHDIMRSEEIKSLGAALHLGMENAVLCVPGTHCKWVWIENGSISGFHSILTGEFYAHLSEAGFLASILPRGKEPDNPDFTSFQKGLDLAREGHDLLADVWQVRCQKLRADNPPDDLRAYFSGILMGHELKQIGHIAPHTKHVVLLGDPGQRQTLYRHALRYYGWNIEAEIGSEVAVCAGLSALKERR